MFVDKVTVSIAAGKGGNGAMSFRHEKYVDRGGPDGGDGGDGGDVVIVGSTRQNTLATFRYQKELTAEDGSPGSKRKRHGKSGKELEVLVPVGTVIYRDGELVADIVEEHQRVVVAHGGKGGFGNAHFVSSRRQAPKVAEKGEPGESLEATLELKIIAEVGLVGLPNAGKSTLLSRISNAKPEIADYPFTTLTPNLGVADLGQERALLVADIPGLIEGAHEGKGLGDEFLRHVERTRILVHLVDAYNDDIVAAYQVIRKELASYRVDLTARPEIVAINKIDGLDDEIVQDSIKSLKKVVTRSTPVLAVSAVSGQGVKDLMNQAAKLADKQAKKEAEAIAVIEDEIPVIRLDNTENRWNIERTKQGFVITGPKVERFAVRTDFESQPGIERLRDIMRKMGIMHELERSGIEADNKIIIGDPAIGEFEY